MSASYTATTPTASSFGFGFTSADVYRASSSSDMATQSIYRAMSADTYREAANVFQDHSPSSSPSSSPKSTMMDIDEYNYFPTDAKSLKPSYPGSPESFYPELHNTGYLDSPVLPLIKLSIDNLARDLNNMSLDLSGDTQTTPKARTLSLPECSEEQLVRPSGFGSFGFFSGLHGLEVDLGAPAENWA
ncbi:hypothetical protein EXIGLDRAFT_731873 [Exidia glandulosa HHB12029]|uniref:Uncharacterized protein n=1 Tax=Exidia glandulosa HHB12029 TaxID=1314781 RepID=A0A165KY23_EXIGL|nr:hypothetical protein EXIGLDRAFT_731873 [Exidia glandulosa HHB12029]